MKVKDLLKVLMEYNQEEEIYLSKDAEGNDFKPLAEVKSWIWEGNDLVCHDAIVLWPED